MFLLEKLLLSAVSVEFNGRSPDQIGSEQRGQQAGSVVVAGILLLALDEGVVLAFVRVHFIGEV